MDAQISGALLGLGLIVITAVGAIVKALTDRVLSHLAVNTELTKETNEGLRDAVERLAAARNTVLALRAVVRERDDRLAYLEARIPDVTLALANYEATRQTRHSAAEEHAAERRILDDIDDPTGTDAGAHPRG